MSFIRQLPTSSDASPQLNINGDIQQFHLKQAESRSELRVLILRIVSLATTVLSLWGFKKRQNTPFPFKNKSGFQQFEVQPSTEPLEVFKWTSIIGGLAQLFCIILILRGTWSRRRRLHAAPKIIHVRAPSDARSLYSNGLERTSHESFAQSLWRQACSGPLLFDVVVNVALFLSIVAVTHIGEAVSYDQPNKAVILCRIVALTLLWAAIVEEPEPIRRHDGAFSNVQERSTSKSTASIGLWIFASASPIVVLSAYAFPERRETITIWAPFVLFIYNSCTLIVQILVLQSPENHLILSSMINLRSYFLAPRGSNFKQAVRYGVLLARFVFALLLLGCLPDLGSWKVFLGVSAALVQIITAVEASLEDNSSRIDYKRAES